MPELPEVETVRRTLEAKITGRKITGVTVNQAASIKSPTAADLIARVRGMRFSTVRRRGKYLLIDLSSGDTMVVHLRMTGRLVYTPAEEPLPKHTHVIFHLDDGRELRFTDQRRFGCIWVMREDETGSLSGLCSLGPEPLGDDFTRKKLAQSLLGKKTKIKAFLLDQRNIAGIGNIYADEILFAGGIHPERPAGSLSASEINRLFTSIKDILHFAVEQRGTSFSDYVDGVGEKGSHQNYLKVYGRGGEPCFRCGTAISVTRVGGRSSHFCSHCQV